MRSQRIRKKRATRTTTTAAAENWLKHLIWQRQFNNKNKKTHNIWWTYLSTLSFIILQVAYLSRIVCVRALALFCVSVGCILCHIQFSVLCSTVLWPRYAVLCYAVFDFFLPVCITFHFLSLSLALSLCRSCYLLSVLFLCIVSCELRIVSYKYVCVFFIWVFCATDAQCTCTSTSTFNRCEATKKRKRMEKSRTQHIDHWTSKCI